MKTRDFSSSAKHHVGPSFLVQNKVSKHFWRAISSSEIRRIVFYFQRFSRFTAFLSFYPSKAAVQTAESSSFFKYFNQKTFLKIVIFHPCYGPLIDINSPLL